MRRTLLAAALLAAPTAASAQADLSTVPTTTVIQGITPVQVAMLLEARGLPATPRDLQTDKPYIETTVDGINYSVNLYACEGAKAKMCEQVQLRAWFDREGGDPAALMTQYERDWVFGKAYVNDEGHMVLEHAFTMRHGITVANLTDSLDLWDGMLQDFKTAIGW